MSYQAVLTNLLLRYHVKMRSRGPLEVAKARRREQVLIARQPPLPADIRHQVLAARPELGLCGAERFERADAIDPLAQRTVLYMHGGGYFFCSPQTHRPVCGYLARSARARVVSIDYRMAPEHPCPAAVDDALAWYRALLAQVPLSQLVLAGDSAGGGLVLACLLAAKAQGLPMPAAAVLFSPWVDLSCSGDTLHSLARADVMFNPDNLPEAAALYLNGRDARDPLASPLFGDLRGLPPLLVFASQHEILLSDSTRLRQRVAEAGGVVTLRQRPRLPHVWPTMVVLPEARESLREAAAFITEHTPAPSPAAPATPVASSVEAPAS